MDQVSVACRRRHLSRRTEQAYRFWIRRYIHFHSLQHPRVLGPPGVVAFINHLASVGMVSASTQSQALNALPRASTAATTTEGCGLAEARPRTGCGIRSSAKCFGTQVSKCKPEFGLAIPVPLSRHTDLPPHRAPPSLACLRVRRTDGLQSSTASSRYCQTCVMPHAKAFVCDSLACGRHRHPDDSTAPGASGPEDHHDLHPCRAGDPDNRQPTRPTTHLLSTPGGHRFDVRYGSIAAGAMEGAASNSLVLLSSPIGADVRPTWL